MARTPKNHEAAAELGARLQQLHGDHGQPNPKAIELWIYKEFGVRVSDEAIRKAHKGQADPFSTSPEILAGIAHYYGVEPINLTPAVKERFMALTRIAGLTPEFRVKELDLHGCRCTRAWQLTLEGFAGAA